MDFNSRELPRIKGTYHDCKYYEYIDSKYFPGGGFRWGYCHLYIEENPKTEEEQFDLGEYFTKREGQYCSDFERKIK